MLGIRGGAACITLPERCGPFLGSSVECRWFCTSPRLLFCFAIKCSHFGSREMRSSSVISAVCAGLCWAVLGSPWLLALSTALPAAHLNEGRGGLSRGCWSSRAPIKTFWSYKISMRWLLFPDGFIPF